MPGRLDIATQTKMPLPVTDELALLENLTNLQIEIIGRGSLLFIHDSRIFSYDAYMSSLSTGGQRMRSLLYLAAALALLISFSSCKSIDSVPKRTPKLLDPGYSGLPNHQQIFRSAQLAKVNDYLLTAMRASDLAYSDGELEGWSRTTLSRPSIGSKETTTVYISKIDEKNKTIDIAVRGTANLDDAYIDIQTSKQLDKDTGTSLHRGFQMIAKIAYTSIREKYGEKIGQGYMIRLYGHSLGGAVASILSMYLHESGATIEFVGTFGAPRFTNNEGARKYQLLNIVTYRVVRCDDAIPFMPPPNIIGWSNNNYEANGNVILLMRTPYFDYSERMDIERDFSHQLRLELSNAVSSKEIIQGHRMKNYGRLLIKLLASEQRPVFYTLAMQSTFCSGDIESRPMPM